MELLIYYLDESGTPEILAWKMETGKEAVLLAEDICRRGILVPDEGKLIPAHRITMVRFTVQEGAESQEGAKEQKGTTISSIRVPLERFAFDLKSMSAELAQLVKSANCSRNWLTNWREY